MKQKMRKSEIRNIISKDWEKRRAVSKIRSEKNSKASAKWQAREKVYFDENELHMETVRRFKHYLGNGPIRNM